MDLDEVFLANNSVRNCLLIVANLNSHKVINAT